MVFYFLSIVFIPAKVNVIDWIKQVFVFSFYFYTHKAVFLTSREQSFLFIQPLPKKKHILKQHEISNFPIHKYRCELERMGAE